MAGRRSNRGNKCGWTSAERAPTLKGSPNIGGVQKGGGRGECYPRKRVENVGVTIEQDARRKRQSTVGNNPRKGRRKRMHSAALKQKSPICKLQKNACRGRREKRRPPETAARKSRCLQKSPKR